MAAQELAPSTQGNRRLSRPRETPIVDVRRSKEPEPRKGALKWLEEGTWFDFKHLAPLAEGRCSSPYCQTPAIIARYTGRRWWLQCREHALRWRLSDGEDPHHPGL